MFVKNKRGERVIMKKRALSRTLLSVTLSAAMIFAGGGTTVPVFAESISDNDAAVEDAPSNENAEDGKDDITISEEVQGTQGYVLRLASAGTGIQAGQHIYYGTKPASNTGAGSNIWYYRDQTAGDKPYWRVLDASKANDKTTNAIFVVAESTWEGLNPEMSFRGNNNSQVVDNWADSRAKIWCDRFYDNVFSGGEQASIIGVNVNAVNLACGSAAALYLPGPGNGPGTVRDLSISTRNKVFILSLSEVRDYLSNSRYNTQDPLRKAKRYDGTFTMYLLRSIYNAVPEYVGVGGVYTLDQYYNEPGEIVRWNQNLSACDIGSYPARPAFNIDKNKVIFVCAARDGKVAGANGVLSPVSSSSVSDWRLTVQAYDGGVIRNNFAANISGSNSATVDRGNAINI